MTVAKAIGVERMARLPQVAARSNFGVFQKKNLGAAVRVGGRLAAAPSTLGAERSMTTTDGGQVLIAFEPDDELELHKVSTDIFFEVVGVKTGDTAMRAAGIVAMGEKVDVELW